MSKARSSPLPQSSSPRRLVALLVAMVAVPVLALSWLGWRLVSQQQTLAEHEVDRLLQDRLRDVDAQIARFMELQEHALLRIAEGLPRGTDEIRAYMRGLARITDVIVIDTRGQIVFPPRDSPRTGAELAFIERTRPLWQGGALVEAVARSKSLGGPAQHGWLAYYSGGGLNLMLWYTDGLRVVAVELPRVTLLSELVSYLPATEAVYEGSTAFRTRLIDASGDVVYQWGTYGPSRDEPPRATFGLSPPLGAWVLEHRAPKGDLPGAALAEALRFQLLLGLAGLTLALGVAAIAIYRARTREMRLAIQRVSFVNQVSHELKTPLTNVRLYAELLADALGVDPEDEDERAADPATRHLSVITSESARLSRLISNVLSFARGQEGRLHVTPAPGCVDDVVRATRTAFAPTLEQAGVEVELDLAAPARVLVDADALEQILANLLTNVEKYARGGGWAKVETRQDASRTVVRVHDRGPGIPTQQRDKVFQAFHRLSDRLVDSAAGTGLGLTIARQLAQLHGGDLRVVDSAAGTCFELNMETRPVSGAPNENGAAT